MSSNFVPIIWSYDTGQWILSFDSCQLTMTWMSTIKDVCCKPSPHILTEVWAAMLCCISHFFTTRKAIHRFLRVWGSILVAFEATGALLLV